MRGVCNYELGNKESAINDWNRVATLGGMDMIRFMTEELTAMKGYNEMIRVLAKK